MAQGCLRLGACAVWASLFPEVNILRPLSGDAHAPGGLGYAQKKNPSFVLRTLSIVICVVGGRLNAAAVRFLAFFARMYVCSIFASI